jgi:ubiquitin-protein ligase
MSRRSIARIVSVNGTIRSMDEQVQTINVLDPNVYPHVPPDLLLCTEILRPQHYGHWGGLLVMSMAEKV